MFNLFRLCRKNEISFDIVAKNGNNVEATFDTAERIVQLVAFDNVDWTLLLVWTGLWLQQTGQLTDAASISSCLLLWIFSIIASK